MTLEQMNFIKARAGFIHGNHPTVGYEGFSIIIELDGIDGTCVTSDFQEGLEWIEQAESVDA